MSFRKTILIDHIAMGRGNILSAEKALDLVILGWVRKTVYSWSGLVNKERREEKEGEQAAQSQPSACHAHFHQNKMGNSVL